MSCSPGSICMRLSRPEILPGWEAQVISGIGFLGAGSIIIAGGKRVKGLTTAAGLWVAGCIGLAIGIGFYAAAVLMTGAVFLVMSKLRLVEEHIVYEDLSV